MMVDSTVWLSLHKVVDVFSISSLIPARSASAHARGLSPSDCMQPSVDGILAGAHAHNHSSIYREQQRVTSDLAQHTRVHSETSRDSSAIAL